MSQINLENSMFLLLVRTVSLQFGIINKTLLSVLKAPQQPLEGASAQFVPISIAQLKSSSIYSLSVQSSVSSCRLFV